MSDINMMLRQFLMSFFQCGELQDDDDIFSMGFVNSLFAMQLIMFIEKKFSISVTAEEMNLENFRTVNKIEAFILANTTSH